VRGEAIVSGAYFEIEPSAARPGTWNWSLWRPLAGGSQACVTARHGFDSEREAADDLRRFAATVSAARLPRVPRRKTG
jgi:hypothetical protein